MIPIGFVTISHVEQSDFGNNKWFLSLKMYEKIVKNRFYEKRYIFETNKDFYSSFGTTPLKPVSTWG